MEDLAPGRREQNKQRTRRALEDAAARLFAEQGFAATTVRDIATAAGVGERTFFRYFPSKEDLVFQQVRDLVPGLMQGVRERPPGESPLAALRGAMLDWLDETGAPPTILVAGPQKGLGPRHEEAHALIGDLEDAVTGAFLDRLEAAGADRNDRAVLLRAAVQARAGVAVVRGMMLVLPGGDACKAHMPAVAPGPALSKAEIRQLLHDAFASLDP
ncbi:TetR/AcrR family transcriptional regulator [Streptacidiphilus sp. N1-12]|uniref:TetR/AcrR family transcriptional regulator n=2 Tax=Streptacidiphilus alkalitolerans TaxID=3342712 RepID=A0ABV6VLW5_9ACTN